LVCVTALKKIRIVILFSMERFMIQIQIQNVSFSLENFANLTNGRVSRMGKEGPK